MPRGISNKKLEHQALTDIRQQVCNFQHAYDCIVGLLDQVRQCLSNESITAKDAEQVRSFATSKMAELQKADHIQASTIGVVVWEERNRFLRRYYAEENRKWRQERGLPPEAE